MATFTVTTTPQAVASASTTPQLFVNNGLAEVVLTSASSGAVLAVLRPGGPSGVQASAVLTPAGTVNATTRRDTASLDVTDTVTDAGLPGAGAVDGGTA